MPRRSVSCLVLAVCACAVMTGCMPKMTIAELKAKMPERPTELDRLDMFVGKWESEGEAKMPILKDQESLKASATEETEWDGDRWFLVSRGVFEMEHLGKVDGVWTWTYDVHSKKYRSTWTDSMGTIAIGESTYDEKTNMWHSKGTSFGPHGKTTAKGWMKVIDDNTMEWGWTEYAGLMKTMEMSGTSRRIQ